MPGSYPDPRLYANTALQALEDAYEESYDTQVGPLILTAIEAIKQLMQEIKKLRSSSGVAEPDPYELNDYNSAI